MKRLKIGVYGPNGSPLVAAVLDGLETLGHRPEHLYHATFSPGNVADEFDAVVACGSRGKLAEVIQHYTAAGVPVILVGDPLLAEDGRRLVTRADVAGWLPPADPTDGPERLKALGLEVAAKRRVKGQAVLVLGQPSSPAASRGDLAAWFDEMVSTLRRVSDSRINYLPAAQDDSRGSEEVDEVLPRGISLADALERSWLVVTHSSPLGLDALVAGLPVVDAGGTVYSQLAGSLQRFAALKAPARAAVERLLRAVLAAQWTVEDIAAGTAFVAPLTGDRYEAGAVAAEPDSPAEPEAPPAPEATPEAPAAEAATTEDSEPQAKAATKGAKK